MMQRAMLVDRVTDRNSSWKTDHVIGKNRKRVKPADVLAFERTFIARERDPKPRFNHRGVSQVCDTQTKRRLAVMIADGNGVTKENTSRRSRETDKDQA